MAFCPECRTPYEVVPDTGARWTGHEEEARLEHQLRLYAPPAALGVAFVAMYSDGLRAIARIFDSMWLHELGHAATAWLSGFPAFPGPWKTSISETRSPLLVVIVAALLVGGGVWAWRTGRRRLALAAAAVLVVQMVFTVVLRRRQAEAMILFFGDGGALVLGALLVATFWAPVGSHLHTSWLRWGFLALGAFGFMDPFTTWWRARRDSDAIPFGVIDGVGDSDATRLVDVHHWGIGSLATRYVLVGVVCLAALAVLGVAEARRRATSQTR